MRLASKGKSLADSSYDSEVKSIQAFLAMQHPTSPLINPESLDIQPEDYMSPRYSRRIRGKVRTHGSLAVFDNSVEDFACYRSADIWIGIYCLNLGTSEVFVTQHLFNLFRFLTWLTSHNFIKVIVIIMSLRMHMKNDILLIYYSGVLVCATLSAACCMLWV